MTDLASLRTRIEELERALEPSEKERWQAWARKRLEIQRNHWLRAAKAALAGDMRELRNRVELSEAEPVEVVLSEDTAHKGGENGK